MSYPFSYRRVSSDEFGSNSYQDTFGNQWTVSVDGDMGEETFLFVCSSRDEAKALAAALNDAYSHHTPTEPTDD